MSAVFLSVARLIAASILSLGIFSAFALRIAWRSFGFISGSGPPSFAAIVIILPSFGNTFDMWPHLFIFAALRYSNALPIFLTDLGCKNMKFYKINTIYKKKKHTTL